MARVTVEDCVDKVENRFELVMLASRRARDIASGSGESVVDRDNDKDTVVALREIAEEAVSLDLVRAALVQGIQKQQAFSEVDEDAPEFDAVDPKAMLVDDVIDAAAFSEAGIEIQEGQVSLPVDDDV